MKTTVQSTTDKAFDILKKRIEKEHSKKVNDFKKELASIKDAEGLKHWRYTDLLTPATKNKNWPSLSAVKEYILGRYIKRQSGFLSKELSHLSAVLYSGDLQSISISVEWKKSAMWGSNPNASGELRYTKNGSHEYDSYTSGSIGGCGYDKQSTAVANVLNQCNPLLRLLYLLKSKNLNTSNRELFGYGSGSGLLPRIEGGVGVSCYPRIFEKLGFTFKTMASGKTFDVYSIERVK